MFIFATDIKKGQTWAYFFDKEVYIGNHGVNEYFHYKVHLKYLRFTDKQENQ